MDTTPPPTKRKIDDSHRCVAYGCSNTKANSGFSTHGFPLKQPGILRQWVNFVKTRMKNFVGPTRHTRLCAAHFDDNCFPLEVKMYKAMGLKKMIRLNDDAVPTIHAPISTPTSSSCTVNSDNPYQVPNRQSKVGGAFAKREHKRILEEAIADSSRRQKEKEQIEKWMSMEKTFREAVAMDTTDACDQVVAEAIADYNRREQEKAQAIAENNRREQEKAQRNQTQINTKREQKKQTSKEKAHLVVLMAEQYKDKRRMVDVTACMDGLLTRVSLNVTVEKIQSAERYAINVKPENLHDHPVSQLPSKNLSGLSNNNNITVTRINDSSLTALNSNSATSSRTTAEDTASSHVPNVRVIAPAPTVSSQSSRLFHWKYNEPMSATQVSNFPQTIRRKQQTGNTILRTMLGRTVESTPKAMPKTIPKPIPTATPKQEGNFTCDEIRTLLNVQSHLRVFMSKVARRFGHTTTLSAADLDDGSLMSDVQCSHDTTNIRVNGESRHASTNTDECDRNPLNGLHNERTSNIDGCNDSHARCSELNNGFTPDDVYYPEERRVKKVLGPLTKTVTQGKKLTKSPTTVNGLMVKLNQFYKDLLTTTISLKNSEYDETMSVCLGNGDDIFHFYDLLHCQKNFESSGYQNVDRSGSESNKRNVPTCNKRPKCSTRTSTKSKECFDYVNRPTVETSENSDKIHSEDIAKRSQTKNNYDMLLENGKSSIQSNKNDSNELLDPCYVKIEKTCDYEIYKVRDCDDYSKKTMLSSSNEVSSVGAQCEVKDTNSHNMISLSDVKSEDFSMQSAVSMLDMSDGLLDWDVKTEFSDDNIEFDQTEHTEWNQTDDVNQRYADYKNSKVTQAYKATVSKGGRNVVNYKYRDDFVSFYSSDENEADEPKTRKQRQEDPDFEDSNEVSESEEELSDSSHKQFQCNIGDCDDIFHTLGDLTHHKLNHHTGCQLCCYLCDKMFSTQQRLDMHVSLVHRPDDEFLCVECGVVCQNYETFQLHELKHTRPFKCTTCGESFYKKKILKAHELSHKQLEKSQKCTICNAKYYSKGALNKHITINHNDVRRILCEQCGMGFMTNSILMSHVRQVHENYRPFKCDICDKAFASRTNLRVHIEGHQRRQAMEMEAKEMEGKENEANMEVRKEKEVKQKEGKMMEAKEKEAKTKKVKKSKAKEVKWKKAKEKEAKENTKVKEVKDKKSKKAKEIQPKKKEAMSKGNLKQINLKTKKKIMKKVAMRNKSSKVH